jgi:phage gp36-like protein
MANLNYTSVQDLQLVMTERTLAELSDDDYAANEDPVIREDVLEQFLAFAESKAESCLHDYELPLTTTPPSFKYAILVICRYMLEDRRDSTVSEDVQESYDKIMKWLDSKPEFKEVDEDLEGFVGQSGRVFNEFPSVDGAGIFPSATEVI